MELNYDDLVIIALSRVRKYLSMGNGARMGPDNWLCNVQLPQLSNYDNLVIIALSRVRKYLSRTNGG